MAYLWRIYRLEIYAAEADEVKTKGKNTEKEGNNKEENGTIRNRRPGYYFTNRQAAAFEQIQEAAAGIIAANHNAQNERWNNSDKSENHEQNTQLLKKYILAFFIALLNYNIGNYEY
jgi:hypothetical protein